MGKDLIASIRRESGSVQGETAWERIGIIAYKAVRTKLRKLPYWNVPALCAGEMNQRQVCILPLVKIDSQIKKNSGADQGTQFERTVSVMSFLLGSLFGM
jgi:hypothetical protein